jgi:hypothetical protein
MIKNPIDPWVQIMSKYLYFNGGFSNPPSEEEIWMSNKFLREKPEYHGNISVRYPPHGKFLNGKY